LSSRRVIVLGLDALNFSLVKDGLGGGLLPHLQEAMALGVSGTLRSTLPPYSAPAWVTFATGKLPDKHEVFDFWRVSYTPRRQLTPMSSHSINGATTWQIASRHGKRVGVVQVPMTYPPRPANGFVVADMIVTPNEQVDYTSPLSLKAEIREHFGEFALNPYRAFGQSEAALRRATDAERTQEQVSRYLLERYPCDLFISVCRATDIVQHHFRSFLVPADGTAPQAQQHERFDAPLRELFAVLDDAIAHRLTLLDGNTVLLIVSDHGFGPAAKVFNVNRFLADLGLAEFHDSRVQSCGRRLVRSAIRVAKALDVLKLRRQLSRETIRSAVRATDEAASLPRDWAHTKAWSGTPSAEGIYVNLKGRESIGIVEPGAEYEEVRQRILDGLRALRDPDTGEPIIEAAYRREEVYTNPPAHCPDILIDFGMRPYKVRETLSANAWLEPMPLRSGAGRHTPEGVFVAVGADVPKGVTVQGLNLVDVAPTLLYALGLPVPQDMDGRVLTEIFTEQHVAAEPPSYDAADGAQSSDAGFAYTPAEEAEITKQLRDLGYV